MIGFSFILLSVACSLLIAHFLKVIETRGMDTLHVLTVNYLVAFLTALMVTYISRVEFLPEFPIWLWGFSAFIGLIFISNFFIFSKSTYQNGIGVSIAAMRLSLLVPVLLSVLIYHETVTLVRGLGFLLVLVSFGLLIFSRRGVRVGSINSHWLLIGIFLFTGMADASLKIFEREGLSGGTEFQYLALVFFSALIFGLGASAYKGELRFTMDEMKMGVFIGVPNLLTSVFLINALVYADGVFVYPAVNVLIIIGGALVGKLYWDDKISTLEASGMAMAILAIMFLL